MKCDSCNRTDVDGLASRVDGLVMCDNCFELFEASALRPDMWERLAYKAGANYYPLCDSFYDDVTGIPFDPEIEVDDSIYESYSLESKLDLGSVESFCVHFFTRHLVWKGDFQDIPKPWGAYVFKLCKSFIENGNVEQKSRAYQLLSLVGNEQNITDYLKIRWEQDHELSWFGIYEAVIKQLPTNEAIEMIKLALLKIQPEQYYHDYIVALAEVGKREALPALREVIVKREPPLMDKLGAYYRCLNPSWSDIKEDIESGRPMSLIAIDSLWIEDGNQYKRWFERRDIVGLELPAEGCANMLKSYLAKDNTPRVAKAIRAASDFHGLNVSE